MCLNNYIVSPHDIQISGKDYVCINMHADMHTYGLVGQRAQKYEEESRLVNRVKLMEKLKKEFAATKYIDIYCNKNVK